MKTKIILLSALLLIIFVAKAQHQPDLSRLANVPAAHNNHVNTISHLNVSATPLQQSASAGGQSPFALALSRSSINLHITLMPLQGISKIVVMLGSSAGSNDVFYKEFDPAQQGQFDDGTSLQRNGMSLNIGINDSRAPLPLHAEVFALLNDGTRSLSRRVIVE